jgi:hypothetical protein
VKTKNQSIRSTTLKLSNMRYCAVGVAVASCLLASTTVYASKDTKLPQAEINREAASVGHPVVDVSKPRIYQGAESVDVVMPTQWNGDIRTIDKMPDWQPGDAIKIANPRHTRPIVNKKAAVNPVLSSKSVLQQQLGRASRSTNDLELGHSIDAFGFNGVNPPDPTGEIGENYYITAINSPNGSAVNFYKKSDGSKVGETIAMSALASGGDCKDKAMGDPIVVFDEYAKRWVLTEFTAEGPNKMCVYVSKTADPIEGGWYTYEFQAPSFPDYPKYAVFGDIYYVSANEGGGAVYAMDRAKMLAGETATMVRKAVPGLAGFGFQSITPVDADGLDANQAGMPGLFIRQNDDELHKSGSNNGEKDYLEIWSFSPDFASPDNSKLEGPFNIEIDELDSNFTCPDGFGCLTQKYDGSGNLSTLDPLKEVVYYKAQYRNFKSHQSIVGSFATKLTDNNAGLRWFELRKGAEGWGLHQEGMVPSSDKNSRYMAGAAMDGDGNLALAYMITGPEQFPSIRVTSRRMGDALGTISANEKVLHEAKGAISTERDGDYSHMSVDPIDHCTFWFTAEHGGENAQWGTKVSSMKVPGCTGVGSTDPGFSLSASLSSQQICKSGELQPIELKVSGFNDFKGKVALAYADLASGITGSFSTNPVDVGAVSSAMLSAADGIAPADYSYKIKATSDGVDSREISGRFKVVDEKHSATLSEPVDGAEKVDMQPELKWTTDGYIQTYTIEIATDEGFENIVATGNVSGGTSYRPSKALAQNTQFYWRVKAANVCGETQTNTRKFTTKSEKDDATEFVNGASIKLTMGEGEWSTYWIDVPEDASQLNVKTSGGDEGGDIDFYIGYNMIPKSMDDVVCHGAAEGSEELCSIDPTKQGTYFILVNAYYASSNVDFTVEYDSKKPSITGQTEIVTDEDVAVELTVESLSITDSDSTSFTVELSDGENYSINGATVVPAANFHGELIVSTKVSDGENMSDSYPVKIQVNSVNDAPVVTADVFSIEGNAENTLDVLANDADIENEALTLESVSYNGSGSAKVENNKVTYKAKKGFNGQEQFTYVVTDASGASSSGSVTVNVSKNEDSSSGSSDWLALLLLPLLAFRRRAEQNSPKKT